MTDSVKELRFFLVQTFKYIYEHKPSQCFFFWWRKRKGGSTTPNTPGNGMVTSSTLSSRHGLFGTPTRKSLIFLCCFFQASLVIPSRFQEIPRLSVLKQLTRRIGWIFGNMFQHQNLNEKHKSAGLRCARFQQAQEDLPRGGARRGYIQFLGFSGVLASALPKKEKNDKTHVFCTA